MEIREFASQTVKKDFETATGRLPARPAAFEARRHAGQPWGAFRRSARKRCATIRAASPLHRDDIAEPANAAAEARDVRVRDSAGALDPP